MNKEKRCPTFLIEDIPADKDSFGPHQRVADAIADLIESSEKGGKVIGLEGGWGAGKSTVVGFLVNRLSKNTNYKVVSFDAWAHEGDPLRRTYLETLIQGLRANGWVDDVSWGNRLEEIARRRKETTTRITPKPTKLGVALAISVLLVPLGSTFLSEGFRSGVTIGRDLPPNWLFVIGLLLALSPFGVLLANLLRIGGIWLTCRFKGKKKDRGVSEWAFLFSKAINETRTETVESANPTSIEFEDYFTRLMSESLGKFKERRCLLILDNLDRVTPDNALAIWSTLQTFLQDRNHHSNGWFSRLWVVVPFDPNGLRKLWDKHISEDSQNLRGINERGASDSFLDKSFQIRFHVPPPVLSDWKAYLYRLVEEALPEHESGDRHWIYRVFDHCRTRIGEPPTPRELKLYINQIGAIHRQWEHTFPIEHVAYYVLQRRIRKSIIQGLRDQSGFPSEHDIAFLGGNLRSSLAGLAFNVAPDKGIELLLAEPIYQCLADDKSDQLLQIEKSNPDGFWAVLEIVATTKLGDTDAQTISKAASCVKNSKILECNQRHESTNILNGLRIAAERVTNWSPFDRTMANGISALCSLVNAEEFSTLVTKAIASTLSDGSKVSEASSEPQLVIEPLLDVMRQITSLGHEKAIPQSVTLPITAEVWPTACSSLAKADQGGKFWGHLRPKAEFSAISKALASKINVGEFNEEDITTIRVTSSSPIKSSWSLVVSEMVQRLDAGANVSPKESTHLLRALFLLEGLGSTEASKALKDLASNGHTLHHFHRAVSEGHQECKALSLFAFLKEFPGCKKPAAAGNSEEGYDAMIATLGSDNADFANTFINLIRQYDQINLLLAVASACSKYDPLVCLGLRNVAESQEAESIFTSSILLDSWKELRPALNYSSNTDHFSSLVGRLAQNTSLCQSIQNATKGFVLDDAELYLGIINGAKEELPDFVQWVKRGLEHLSQADWTRQLTSDFSCCRLALALTEQDRTPDLKTGFSDALVSHADLMISGSHVPPNELRPQWRGLLNCLSEEATRKELRTRLIGVAASQDGKLPPAFFEMYGEEISEIDALVANNQIVSHLFSPILRERNVDGLKWLNTVLDSPRDLLDKVSDEITVEAFINRLRDISPVADEAQPLIEQIAAGLGVEVASLHSAATESIDQGKDTSEGGQS